MRVPLPEFAGSAVDPVEVDVPDFVPVDLDVDAFELPARTFGAVASACAASTPTAVSATSVIIATEKVAPRPDLGRSAARGGAGGCTGPRPWPAAPGAPGGWACALSWP